MALFRGFRALFRGSMGLFRMALLNPMNLNALNTTVNPEPL